jgi:hypothetical protein
VRGGEGCYPSGLTDGEGDPSRPESVPPRSMLSSDQFQAKVRRTLRQVGSSWPVHGDWEAPACPRPLFLSLHLLPSPFGRTQQKWMGSLSLLLAHGGPGKLVHQGRFCLIGKPHTSYQESGESSSRCVCGLCLFVYTPHNQLSLSLERKEGGTSRVSFRPVYLPGWVSAQGSKCQPAYGSRGARGAWYTS